MSDESHIEEGVLWAYQDGALEGQKLADVSSHLSHCDVCQERLLELTSVLFDLRTLPMERAPDGFLDGVRQRVEADRAKSWIPDWLRGIFAPGRAWQSALAVAAVGLFVVVVARSPESERLKVDWSAQNPSSSTESKVAPSMKVQAPSSSDEVAKVRSEPQEVPARAEKVKRSQVEKKDSGVQYRAKAPVTIQNPAGKLDELAQNSSMGSGMGAGGLEATSGSATTSSGAATPAPELNKKLKAKASAPSRAQGPLSPAPKGGLQVADKVELSLAAEEQRPKAVANRGKMRWAKTASVPQPVVDEVLSADAPIFEEKEAAAGAQFGRADISEPAFEDATMAFDSDDNEEFDDGDPGAVLEVEPKDSEAPSLEEDESDKLAAGNASSSSSPNKKRERKSRTLGLLSQKSMPVETLQVPANAAVSEADGAAHTVGAAEMKWAVTSPEPITQKAFYALVESTGCRVEKWQVVSSVLGIAQARVWVASGSLTSLERNLRTLGTLEKPSEQQPLSGETLSVDIRWSVLSP